MKTKLTVLLVLMTAFCFSQPTQIKDIDTYCCSGGSLPSNLFVYNSLIYFSADDSAGTNSPGGLDLGRELWISDGTTIGTVLLKDLNSGALNSSPNNFFVFNNNLYFSANSGSGDILFTTDGSEMGTEATSVIREIRSPVELNGMIYFANASDRKLYEFNGTSANPVTGSGNEYIQDYNIKAYNGKIFCYMNTSTEIGTFGTELYAYDPNLDSFQLIKNIAGGQLESELLNFTVLGTDLYFSAFAESELWKTDGTESGTGQVTVTSGIYGFNNLFEWNGKLFFEGDDGNADQLWVYDPDGNSITNLSNISGTAPNHDPSDFTELDGWLYYRGEDSNDNDGHLWRTNGTASFQLDDTITINANLGYIVVLNNKLYFRGTNGTDGFELFEFDPATLSINTISKTSISIFPNPTSEFINIRSEIAITKIEIFDFLGKGVLTTGNQNKIDIRNLQSGIYLVKFNSEKGSSTKKIMVR